jgi:hypothetical protein
MCFSLRALAGDVAVSTYLSSSENDLPLFGASVTDYFHQGAFAPAAIEFSVEDLFPGAKVQLAFGHGNNDLAPHHLPLHVSISVILTGSIVLVLRGRSMGGQFLQPHLVIMQESFLRIIYENRRGYMHGVYQTKTLLDATLAHEVHHRLGDIHETTAIRHFEPKVFCQAFHQLLMPKSMSARNPI